MKIGFIGLGNMAKAIMSGMLSQKVVSTEDIIGSEIIDIIFLAVKPQYFHEVISGIKDIITEKQIIISIAAGKTMSFIENEFETKIKLVRCMPNAPAIVGEGCTGFCLNEFVTYEEKEFVLKLLNSFGKASLVSEKLMDVVVAVSGSSPAYVFILIEAMADAAVSGGMPRAQAYEFAAQAVLGSAKMVLETGKHPGELKDMVCSPEGTTIEAVKTLEKMGFRAAVMEAMEVCMDKSKNM